MAIRYEARFGPVERVFASRHISGWQVWCQKDDEPSYAIALCINRASAGIAAGALQHAADNNVSVTLPQSRRTAPTDALVPIARRSGMAAAAAAYDSGMSQEVLK